jgi:D-alanyl-lipoteichoic acid acyltransferase DltB (MBOAT superfamily)
LSFSGNLGLLAFFKYYFLFTDLTRNILNFLGFSISFPVYNFLLPVGISFYTFKTLSYTIGVYRGEIDCELNFIKYSIFVSFFPLLIAGPIIKASNFLPQIRQKIVQVSENNFMWGLSRVFKGLFKKIVIADILSQLGVDAIFANPAYYSSIDLLFALYGYAFQIYYDFSGYSDIAIGAATMLGFNIPENFNRPYISQNIREFWQRWHISLSTWFRDYLYLPIAYSATRKFTKKSYFGIKTDKLVYTKAIAITFLLCGLWHGASLNFIIWGGYHGFLIILSRFKKSAHKTKSLFTQFKRQLVCFHLVLFGWLLFRINHFNDFVEYINGLLKLSSGSQLNLIYFLILFIALIIHICPQNYIESTTKMFIRIPVPVQALVYTILILIFLGFGLSSPRFIYFQF